MRWLLRFALLAFGVSALAVGGWQLTERPRSVAPAAHPPTVNSQPSTLNPAALAIPVLGIVRTQLKDTFDEGRVGHQHRAIDILAARGTPVVAAVDGTVRKLFFSGAGGITVYEFDDRQELVYYYAHLDRYADGLREGMRLRRGDVIGYVGTTGNAPPGTPHLHFAIARLSEEKKWWHAEAIDPYPILMERGVTLTATGASVPATVASTPN